jgi:hypothetical protein
VRNRFIVTKRRAEDEGSELRENPTSNDVIRFAPARDLGSKRAPLLR